jgi:hypothetical protein
MLGPRRTGREQPPNLRPSVSTRLCANCKFFRGICTMYDYPTDASQVCDSWYPRS